MNWQLELALLSCALLGMRHGFDYDHLAAISDIAAVQNSWKKSMRLGVTYALGHALTVVALGAAVIVMHISLPEKLNSWSERIIGITLIALGIGVVASLWSRKHSHNRMQSRLAVLISGCNWAWWKIRRVSNPDSPRPVPFNWNYSGKSVFMIGVVHGLGAETPSQLMLFLLAASLGGTAKGFMGLGAFAIGLVGMNTLMTASLGGLFGAGNSRPHLYHWVAWAGAVYSVAVGVVFLVGSSAWLPSFS